MLLPNQRKTIEEAVARGEALNVEMSSALLAAFQEAEKSWCSLSTSLQEERRKLTNLQYRHDDVERLKKQIGNRSGSACGDADPRSPRKAFTSKLSAPKA